MHGAEDDPVFNRPQEFFVGFQKGRKAVKIGRCHLEDLPVRSIPPASDTVAGLAMALIYGFPACGIGGIILGVEERSEQEADDPMLRVTLSADIALRGEIRIIASSSQLRKTMGVCSTLEYSLAIDHKIQSRSVLKKAGLVVRERRNVKRETSE